MQQYVGPAHGGRPPAPPGHLSPPPGPSAARGPGWAGPPPHGAPPAVPPRPAPGQPAPAPQPAAPRQVPPQHPGGGSQPAPPPRSEGTGQVRLPAGTPVQIPPPPARPTPGTAPQDGPLEATQVPVAVLLIGPAGAGKTTVARYWAERRRVPTAHISLDDVREWVRAGFADPQQGWSDGSEAQYRLARRTCGFAARNFLANGISCILDDAVFPDWPVVGLGGWKRHVGPGLIPVVLLPGLDVVLERNAERSGNRRLSDEEVARIHGRMAGWYSSGLPIIDNTRHGVEATARLLDEAVARSLASPPSW
ncbi:AAA family ATPase [Streptomyces sp. WMMC897]|uniref:AAA family ATPase n=1 Tax=Streptomyces sp. WMMC897 TaxID=3014782 RepID=UPI0022B71513|nr:AAA family ATPase [Streptomyces sp. WMMC897]MCZ7413284.1 AAA family ATPase [Streptomyces sp. WMMC897]